MAGGAAVLFRKESAMRMNRGVGVLMVAVVSALWLSGVALGADKKAKAANKPAAPDPTEIITPLVPDEKPAPGVGKGKKEKGTPRDAVSIAFALPKGVVLNDKQTEAYNKLKADMEPMLRKAIEQVEQASKADKAKAAKEVKEIRTQIHTKLTEIVYMPMLEARQKFMEEAAKRGKQQPGRPRR
jgi:hypothetical protein